MLANESWVQDQPLNVVDIPRITALEKTDFFLSQQVLIANSFWLGMLLCVHSPFFSVLGFRSVCTCGGLTEAVIV